MLEIIDKECDNILYVGMLETEKREKPMKKKESWVKFRHKVVTALLAPPFGLYVRWKYGIKIEKFPEQGKRPYLIVMNHQTAYDQFFVSLTFNRPVY